MKVLLINGSPHAAGTTFAALSETARAIEGEGIATEIFHIGTRAIHSCAACGHCKKSGTNRCVFSDDPVNVILEKAEDCDGFIFGSPVHYAGPSGAIHAVMCRLFYAGGPVLAHKPAAAVVCCRRAGSTAALDVIQKFFPIGNMPMVPSQYWPMVHGHNAQDAAQDKEGMQTVRTLGRNMAWMVKCFEAGRAAGIEPPKSEPREWTHFIR